MKQVDGQKAAKAINEWFYSEDAKKCLDGTAEGQYLRNRLWYAFNAGYEAGHRDAQESAQ